MNSNKKLSRRERDRQPSAAKTDVFSMVNENKGPNTRRLFSIIMIVLAMVLYVQTIGFDYTHDDFSVIKENTIVNKGIKSVPQILKTSYRHGYMNISDGLYRPLSLIMFAVEWSISPNSPGLHHLMNVLLYAITALFLFRLLMDWMPAVNILIPAATTLLFIAHPVHTEIVSSIKSRDEILCFLFSILSLRFMMSYSRTHKIKNIISSLLCFFMALLSKETGVVLVVLIPITLFYFSSLTLKQITQTSLYYLLPIGIYFIIRYRVLHSLPSANPISPVDNFLVAAPDFMSRLASCFNILAEYLRLLLFPKRLVSDYSTGTVHLVDWSDTVPIISLLMHAGLFVYVLFRFKSNDPLVYGIIYYLVAIFLFSNILLVIGTPMAERFLYIPSLGFCLVISVIISKLTLSKKENSIEGIRPLLVNNKVFVGVILLLIGVYSLKTLTRSHDWLNNETLYSNDVVTAPSDYRLHYYLGRELTRENELASADSSIIRARFQNGIEELEKAKKLNPDFWDAFNQVAVAHTRLKEYKKAEENYLLALKGNPSDVNTLNNLGSCYGMQGKLDDAEKMFKRSLEFDQNNYVALVSLANTYDYKGDKASASFYRSKLFGPNLSGK